MGLRLEGLTQLRLINQMLVTSGSRDKLNTLYYHYQNPYGYQTWQDGSLPWKALSNTVSWLFDHVALQDHVTN